MPGLDGDRCMVLSAAANSIIPAFHAMPVGKLLFKLILSLRFFKPPFSLMKWIIVK